MVLHRPRARAPRRGRCLCAQARCAGAPPPARGWARGDALRLDEERGLAVGARPRWDRPPRAADKERRRETSPAPVGPPPGSCRPAPASPGRPGRRRPRAVGEHQERADAQALELRAVVADVLQAEDHDVGAGRIRSALSQRTGRPDRRRPGAQPPLRRHPDEGDAGTRRQGGIHLLRAGRGGRSRSRAMALALGGPQRAATPRTYWRRWPFS